MTPDPLSAASPNALIAFTFPYVVALSLCMARPMGIALVLPVFTRTSMGMVPAAGFSFALALPSLGLVMEGLPVGGAIDALTLALVAGKEVLAGALLGLLLQRGSRARAVAVSSILFGCWHVLPTLETLTLNPVGAVVGDDPARTGGAVLAAVAVTAAAGLGFSWLRLRGDSVLAPVVAHAAVNGSAFVAARLVARSAGR